MSHQTGIKCNPDLLSFMNTSRSGTTRAMKISIADEELRLDEHCEAGLSWEGDWNRVVPSLVKPEQPTYVLYRLDSQSSRDCQWVLISWSPDDSPPRQKMLYASTKATLKKQFGSTHLAHEMFATTKDEVSLTAYHNYLKSLKEPAPLSVAEAQLESVKLSELSSMTSPVNTLSSVAFAMSDEAKQTISKLPSGSVNYVCLSIDQVKETVNLCDSGRLPVGQLANRVPSTQASYNLYMFTHTHEGNTQNSLVFIYVMPGYERPIRERMLYSSCKAAVVSTIETELQLHITKKLEVSDPKELTEEFLLDEIHPKEHLYKPMFDKPKLPGSRGRKPTANIGAN